MQKVEVNAMTALVEGIDVPTNKGSVSGWGWTHWDGPEAGGKLYIVYSIHYEMPSSYAVYSEGKLIAELERDVDVRQWAFEKGWRSVVNYHPGANRVGAHPD